MKVEHLEVLLEEPSMESALERLLPKMTAATFSLHPHQGKDDLLGKLRSKLEAYRRWIPASTRVLVIVDRDDDDCAQLKHELSETLPACATRRIFGRLRVLSVRPREYPCATLSPRERR